MCWFTGMSVVVVDDVGRVMVLPLISCMYVQNCWLKYLCNTWFLSCPESCVSNPILPMKDTADNINLDMLYSWYFVQIFNLFAMYIHMKIQTNSFRNGKILSKEGKKTDSIKLHHNNSVAGLSNEIKKDIQVVLNWNHFLGIRYWSEHHRWMRFL